MKLHVESHGSGIPLVMLHGWGMHGGIWEGVIPLLAQHFRVHTVDLPGYGASPAPTQYNLDTVVRQLMAHFTEPAAVCGWSLGGQVALRWAQLQPQQVDKLVLVASTPSFVQRSDWQWGMAAHVLLQFSQALAQDYEVTLKRFVALQMRGSEAERELLAETRRRLFSRGQPDAGALHAGLEILRDTDLRLMLPQLGQPALVIAGERDQLVPAGASAYLAQQLPQARLVSVKGAAHAPFLSHPQIFTQQITSFLHE
ncbi:MAG: pimeloyl-ACP methyl ester esterase BioH [Pseudomonadota bacterium]